MKSPILLISTLFLLPLTPTLSLAGGANIGSTNQGSQFLIEWCRGNLGILEDARAQADLSVLDGDFDTASAVLDQAFRAAASQSVTKSDFSMVYRALLRTIRMNEALKETLAHTPYGGPTQFVFLDSSIDLILKEIAPIDTTYYIPYRSRNHDCHNCNPPLDAVFEKRFQQTAQREIDWFLDHFATLDGRTGAVIPKHNAKVYLKIMEFVTLFVAEDLSDSLWQARYSCMEQQLKRLNLRLASYNTGNIAAFKDDRRAILSATAELRQIRDNISRSCGQAH